jgi:hypothetical protein
VFINSTQSKAVKGANDTISKCELYKKLYQNQFLENNKDN